MKERDFLKQLDRSIKDLPANQREDILADYRTHFEEARARGKSEDETSTALGDPRSLGKSFLAEYHIQRIVNPVREEGGRSRFYHLVRGTLVLLSLLAFNFFFMLWAFLAAVTVLGAGWAVMLLLLFVELIIAVSVLFVPITLPLMEAWSAKFALIFFSFSAAGFTVLGVMLLAFVTRLFAQGLMSYIRLNVRAVQP